VTWQGWGVALAWWANLFGDDQAVADLVWSMKTGIDLGPTEDMKNLPGLGMNIARYNAGGSIGAARGNDPPGKIGELEMNISDTVDYKRIQGFWKNWYDKDPNSNSWNWDTDSKQIKALKLAKQRGADIFEVFSNSPLWWMTKSKNPAGTFWEGGENLQDWNINDHAYYLAQVIKYFDEKHHIHFHSVSPFNEPRGNKYGCWWKAAPGNTGQEGDCVYVEQQSKIISEMRSELDKAGYGDVAISASEENTYDMAKRTWEDMSEEIKKMIPQINVHGYQGFDGDRVFLSKLASEDRKLWLSEYSDDDRWPSGSVSNGMKMANIIQHDFEDLGMSAWNYWQIFDQTDGWGLLKFANSASEGWWGENRENWHVNTKFYVLAQFTRHIRPGMKILKTWKEADNGAFTVAGYDSALRKLALVTTNYAGQRWLNYDLSDLKVDGVGSAWTTNPSKGLKYKKTSEGWSVKDNFGSSLEPWSIRSFEIDGVDL